MYYTTLCGDARSTTVISMSLDLVSEIAKRYIYTRDLLRVKLQQGPVYNKLPRAFHSAVSWSHLILNIKSNYHHPSLFIYRIFVSLYQGVSRKINYKCFAHVRFKRDRVSWVTVLSAYIEQRTAKKITPLTKLFNISVNFNIRCKKKICS